MPNRLALVGAAFIAIAALLGTQRASAEGNLVLYCAVQEEWCRCDGPGSLDSFRGGIS